MTTEEIAALQANQKELEKQLKEKTDALAAMQSKGEATEESINANEAQLKQIEAELKAARLQTQVAEQQTIITKQRKADAEEAVKAAVLRGAILPKDFATQKTLIAQATENPSFLAVIKGMQGSQQMRSQERLIVAASEFGGRVQVANEAPLTVFGEFARIVARQSRGSRDDRARAARDLGQLYAAQFNSDNASRLLAFPVEELSSAIEATDVTDGSLGTLAGVLVTQRTLELLKFTFPALTQFTTDFSDQPATFNQQIITRIITVPNVTSYNTSTGWAASTAATTDVPVTLDNHKGVTIEFNEQILASTIRRLFDEFGPASAYALAKDIVDDLYSNITDANFTNNTVKATSSFARADVSAIGTALDLRGVPYGSNMRTLLLYPTVFEKVVNDTIIATLAAYSKSELISQPAGNDGIRLAIPVDGMAVIKAPNLPTNNGNVTGFAGSKSALCIVTRIPNDYTVVLPGANNGSVQVVTDPDIGMSVMLTQYVNHTLGRATSRIALMYGTNAGQGNAGQLLKAASGTGSSRA